MTVWRAWRDSTDVVHMVRPDRYAAWWRIFCIMSSIHEEHIVDAPPTCLWCVSGRHDPRLDVA